jgi:hypothetical protein
MLMRLINTKKGDTSSWVIVVAIVILLITAAVLIGVFGSTSKKATTGIASFINCNSEETRCACFYSGICPDRFQKKVAHSNLCPPDAKACTDDNYNSLLKELPKEKDKQESWYGTCCMLPVK